MRIIIVFTIGVLAIYLTSCAGCANSESNDRRRNRTNNRTKKLLENPKLHPEKQWTGKSEIKMVKENGVYKIPIEINDTIMDFIFDTGASSICISETEAQFLMKKGTLSQADVVGESSFLDANGDVSSGMVIKLKSVKIGDRTLNDVEALIVPNDKAPLLLGQTALAQFGKISIDYKNGTITFE
jgi:aspartyl protease family protein